MFKIDSNLKFINQIFSSSGFEIRIVGGAVRDYLLGLEPKDIDLCTNATPYDMIEIGNRNKITVLPTGINHGTVTFMLNGIPYEITTLRIDTETNGRHATVKFTNSFMEDAKRRDLTINAMYMDFNGKIYDYFNGMADLNDNVIKFVGDPTNRISEDYLRILRFFRFAARFDAAFDEDALTAINTDSARLGLATISIERIWSEMKKIVMFHSRVRILRKMEEVGILSAIGINIPVNEDRINNSIDDISAISTFVDNDMALTFANNWKFSRHDRDKLIFLKKENIDNPTIIDVQDFLTNGIPRDWVVAWANLYGSSILINEALNYKPNNFPITGADLINKGIVPGKEMGKIIGRLKNEWFKSRFELSKEELLNLV